MKILETITNFHIAFLSLQMFSSTICILTNTTQALSSSLLPILDFSVGNSHLTVMYGSTPGTLNVQQIRMHNMVTGTSFLVNQSISGSRQFIREPPGKNNESSFMYILNDEKIIQIISQNSTKFYYSYVAFGKYSIYFSSNLNVQNILYQTEIWCRWTTLQTDNSINLVQIYTNYSCQDFKVHSSGIVFNFLISNLDYTGLVSVYNQTSYTLLYQQFYPQSSSSTNFYGQVSQLYYCIVLNDTFIIKTIALRSLICNVSVAEQIYNTKITEEFVFISISNAIKQYNITSCSQIGSFATTGVAILRVHVAPINILYYMYPNTSTIYRLNFSQISTSPDAADKQSNRSYKACYHSCKTCSILSENICETCKMNRIQSQDGKCHFSTPTHVVVTSVNTANNFRFGSVQSILCILDGIQKYKYHKTNYSGLIQQTITQINDLNSLKWNLISIQAINQWMQGFDGTDSYNFFTNSKFLSVQRKNALIFQTTKAFYSVSIPFNLLIFALLNRLFRLLNGHRISSAIRQFSFGLQFFMIVVISNSNTICFLANHYFSVLFSLTYAYKLLHALSLIAIGIFLLILLSFFFMSAYFYGKLSKYFLPNLYRMNCAYFYSFAKFSLQPLIQSALHFFLYENGELQLICLACFEGCFFFLQIATQLNFEAFKSKMTFICESCLQFSMALLNIFLLLAYYKLKQQSNEIVQIINFHIRTLCFCMFGIICFAFLQLLLMVVFNIFFRKKRTDDIWNWGERVEKQQKERIRLLRKRRKQIQELQKKRQEDLQEGQQKKVNKDKGKEKYKIKGTANQEYNQQKELTKVRIKFSISQHEKIQSQRLQKTVKTTKGTLKLKTQKKLICSYISKDEDSNRKRQSERGKNVDRSNIQEHKRKIQKEKLNTTNRQQERFKERSEYMLTQK